MMDAQRALTPSHDLGPRLVTSEPSSNATHLALRVWSSTRSALHWRSESTLVFMLADLIAASGGVPVEDAGLGLVASFEQPAEAFRAAKRIQWSVLEFSQQQPAQCLGAAVAVYHISDLTRGNRDEAAQGIAALLEQAKPSQIYLAAKAAGLLQDIPGLQLRKRTGPSLAATEFEREAQELVWTTPQTQRRVQELLKQAARKVNPKTDPVAPSEPTVELTREAIRPTTAQIHAALFRVDHPSDDNLTVADASAPDLSAVDPAGIILPAGRTRPTDARVRSGSNLLWWSLPAIGVLAVLVTLYFLMNPRSQTVPENPALVEQPRPTDRETPKHQQPVQTKEIQPHPEAQPSLQPSATPSQSTPPQRGSRQKPVDKAAEKVAEYEGFSERDIPGLLRKAESDAGGGDYANARREYDIILRLDPNNAAAKQGIHKLNLSEQDAH